MKTHKIETKQIKVVATIFDETRDEDDYDEVEFKMMIPTDEWTRLIEEGMFSFYFDNVIQGYKKWLEELSKCEVYICFEEVKENGSECK